MIATNPTPLTITLGGADDLAILAEAIAGEVDVLVTRDRGLLDIADDAPLHTVTSRGFWELLRSPALTRCGDR